MTVHLGGLTPARFLREYWQKRPLLIRQAIPGFAGIAGLPDRDALLALCCRSDATSRLIIRHPRRWERHDGPFGALEAGMLPARRWTVLVHGVESLVPGGWELLRAFSFIPAARIDDLMVSYAADGGSVGPHDDLYDVFLLQGPGRRRWQVSRQSDRTLDERAAIKVLKRFVPEEEWLLEPGDMLYLPPGVAHHGTAEGPCFTYSIGFLAPTHADLVRNFLAYLGEARAAGLNAMYEDPDLRPPRRPLTIGDEMVDRVAAVLGRIRWDRGAVADFLGRFLTMPRPHAVFTPPRRPLSARALRSRGRLRLALPSRGLVRPGRLFLNGESHPADRATLRVFERLVLERVVQTPIALGPRALELFQSWHASGYLLWP